MTDDERALLRTILERPEDDLPRLVFADWLEENGELERGEFVRVQVELARLTQPDVRERTEARVADAVKAHTDALMEFVQKRDALRWRERALWSDGGVGKQFGAHHQPPIPLDYVCLPWEKTADLPGSVGVVRRGFVEAVSCPLATLFGGRCRTCENWARIDGDEWTAGHPICHQCHGTGRITGVAAALWTGHPVTRVTLTDREPVELSGGWWWGCTNGRQFAPDAAPDELLNDYFEFGPHPDREAAMSYLSGRIVAWGRSLAVSSPRH